MSDLLPTVALYHHLPPGGADRAMYELVRRTNRDFRYVLYEIEPSSRDPFHGADRSPLADVVADRKVLPARSGGASTLGRWAVSVPATMKAESKIARAITADASIDLLLVHHQRFLQAPTLLRKVKAPRAYFVHEPRRRSFEYDLKNPPGMSGFTAALTRPIDAWAARTDVANTRAADLLLCNSENTREYIWRAYGRDATVVPLGVDIEHFRLGAGTDRANEVLGVGSLDPSKGHDLAIAALGLLPDDKRPAFRIVHNRADPTTRSQLKRHAESAGVELHLDESIGEDELVARYQQAKALVLTARVEPLGLAALEAMACGTPVVAVREGGFRETVRDGVTGLLTERTADGVAGALERVISGDFAPSPAELHAAAKEQFGWAKAVDTYRTALDWLLRDDA